MLFIIYSKTNPKSYGIVYRLLHRQISFRLLDCSDTTTFADSFGTFFKEKITKIRAVFQTCQSGQDDNVKPNYTPPLLASFQPLTKEDVRKLISKSTTKSCDLDPCPTFIINECLAILLTPITNIIILYICEGVFPDRFKQAIVTPLLKNPTLDKDTFKNYRPVSKLNFLSKVTEQAVASQIKTHI